ANPSWMKLGAVTSSSSASDGLCSGWVNTCFGPVEDGCVCEESVESFWVVSDEPPDEEPLEPLCVQASGANSDVSTSIKEPSWNFIVPPLRGQPPYPGAATRCSARDACP